MKSTRGFWGWFFLSVVIIWVATEIGEYLVPRPTEYGMYADIAISAAFGAIGALVAYPFIKRALAAAKQG